MNSAGDEFFAGSAFPRDQDARGADVLQAADIVENSGDGRTLPDEARNAPAVRFLVGEMLQLFVRALTGVYRRIPFMFCVLSTRDLRFKFTVFLPQGLGQVADFKVRRNPKPHLFFSEGLRDVIDRARFKPFCDRDLIVFSRDEDDRDISG